MLNFFIILCILFYFLGGCSTLVWILILEEDKGKISIPIIYIAYYLTWPILILAMIITGFISWLLGKGPDSK